MRAPTYPKADASDGELNNVPSHTYDGRSGWWNNERVEELKIRWANNETGSAICRAMGAPSRNAVIGKAHRLKLAPRLGSGFNAPKRSTLPRSRKAKAKISTGPSVNNVAPLPRTFENPKSFAELAADECHWPDLGEASDRYCAAPVWPGRSYCVRHCGLAYQKPGRRP